MTQWAYTPSFNYTVSTTLAIYCTQTDRLPQWAYTPSFNYTVSTTLAIYCTQTDRLPQWAHTSSFMTQWAYTPSFTYRVSTTLAIYCTYTVQPQFLPYLQSGPMPPHFATQCAPPKPSTGHKLSSLSSSLICTVGLYLLIL